MHLLHRSFLVLYISKEYSALFRIAGNPLESYKLQRNDEISINVKVENYKNWAISSQASNRGRFNDQS